MKKKIALISPGKEGSVVSGRWKGIVNFYRLTLPLLYSMVPKDIFDVDIYDESVDQINESIYSKRYDLVAMSVMTPYADIAYEHAKKFKQYGSTIIMGGHHPTLMHEEVLLHCDAVVIGDAEMNWPRMLSDFIDDKLKSLYSSANNCYINDKKLIPDRSVLKSKSLMVFSTVETSRGCPYSCEYCTIAGIYKTSYVQYSVDSVVYEISQIKDKFIFFVDDNFFGSRPGDRERTIKLLKALIPLKKKWFCQATIKIADDLEILQLSVKAGCMAVYLGLESISKESLLEVKKTWNRPDSYYERIKRIRDSGIAIEAGIIFGFDNDDESIFDKTTEFVIKTGIESPNAHILTPYPGTPLFVKMEKEKRILTKEWKYYNTGNVVFIPKKMSVEMLANGYQNWYNDVFKVKNIISRMMVANFRYYSLLTNIAKNREIQREYFKSKKYFDTIIPDSSTVF
jgi:radical SAM superfamily enzyme YgiQ (UPF0313 family)